MRLVSLVSRGEVDCDYDMPASSVSRGCYVQIMLILQSDLTLSESRIMSFLTCFILSSNQANVAIQKTICN